MTDIDVLIRIAAAIIIGGVVGWERESCNRPAGFRTHTLVCLVAAIVMMTGIFTMQKYGDATTIAPSYIAAAVLSGIGFLGAGTILRSGVKVKGLTTAASLWSVAGLGLAVGSGFYLGACVGAFVVLLTLTIFERVAKKSALGTKHFHAHIVVTCMNPQHAVDLMTAELLKNGITVRIVSIAGDINKSYKIEGRLESRKANSYVNFLSITTSLHKLENIEGIKVSEF
jgi:putative Mg2+ transporter-C (MgtC) family protein